MGKKEKYQKELDFLLEKLRFWRYVVFALVSAMIGVGFSVTQKKVDINLMLLCFMGAGFIGLLLSVMRINFLTKKYFYYLELLEKED